MSGSIRLALLRLPLLVAMATCGGSALSASGEFIFVTGEVTLIKAPGQRAAAVRGMGVDPGDQITTGTNGMAQLTMVDKARLSLRPNTTFRIVQYTQKAGGEEGVVLSLVRGTLRAFTGLIAATNREKFIIQTKVATVGVRGSGNILHAARRSAIQF